MKVTWTDTIQAYNKFSLKKQLRAELLITLGAHTGNDKYQTYIIIEISMFKK